MKNKRLSITGANSSLQYQCRRESLEFGFREIKQCMPKYHTSSIKALHLID